MSNITNLIRPRNLVAAGPLPRHIRNLNALATRAGMRVSTSIEPHDDNSELRLWSRWEGSRAQLFATGILSASQQRSLSIRIKPSRLVIPPGEASRRLNTIADGYVSISGDFLTWTIDCGPADYRVTQHDGVEVVTYAEEAVRHGDAQGLIADGVDPKRIPVGKPGAKCNNLDFECTGWWSCRRQPDGLYVYRSESDAALEKRRERHKQLYPEPAAAKPAPTCASEWASETRRRLSDSLNVYLETVEGFVAKDVGTDTEIPDKSGDARYYWSSGDLERVRQFCRETAGGFTALLQSMHAKNLHSRYLRLVIDNEVQS